MYRLSYCSGKWIAYDMGDDISDDDLQDIKILVEDGMPTMIVDDLEALDKMGIEYEGPCNDL